MVLKTNRTGLYDGAPDAQSAARRPGVWITSDVTDGFARPVFPVRSWALRAAVASSASEPHVGIR